MLLFTLTACLFNARSAIAPSAAAEARITYPKSDEFYGLPVGTVVDVARLSDDGEGTCFDVSTRWAIANHVEVIGNDVPKPQQWKLVGRSGRARATDVHHGELRQYSLEAEVVVGYIAAGYCHQDVCVAWDSAGTCIDTVCIDEQEQGEKLRESMMVVLNERDDRVCFDAPLPDGEIVELRRSNLFGRQRFLWQNG